MLPQNTKAYSATATFILGRPSTPILSWLFPGWSAIAAKHTWKPSLLIWLHACQEGFNSQPTGTALISVRLKRCLAAPLITPCW